MKKQMSIMLSLVLVLSVFAVLGTVTPVTKAADQMEITLVAHSAAISFWRPVKKGAEDAAKQLGVKVNFTGPADMNSQKQVAIIESLIAKGVDGIATTIPDPKAFDNIIQKALDKGIPVVAFNTDDETENPRMASIAQQQYGAGKRMAEEITQYVQDGGKVALTTEAPGHSALEARLKGAKDVLDEHNIEYKVINTTTDLVKAVETIRNYYQANPDTNGWFGVSATATAAGAKAVEKLNLSGKVFAGGFDLTPTTLQGIKNGTCAFTVDQFPYIQGYYSVVELYLYNKYGIYPSNIDTGAGIIDSSNIEQVMKLGDKGYR